jgi:ubiquinone/menaquinone biosynthesis C-methylase UbiE
VPGGQLDVLSLSRSNQDPNDIASSRMVPMPRTIRPTEERQPGIDAFRELAPAYDSWLESPLGSFVASQQMAALEAALSPVRARSRILEVGAGTGQVVGLLAARGYRVIAVEPAEGMLRLGRDRTAAQGAHWVRAIAEALPIAGETVDAALFFTSIEFVEDAGAALAEARRVLRTGGLLVVGFLDVLSPWAARYRSAADHSEAPWTAARFFTLVDLQARVGFEPESVESVVFLAPDASPPYDEADKAGHRAGNHGALTLVSWRKA